jgi:hypothetical protein
MTTTPHPNEPEREPAVPRLLDVRKALGYPPFLLMTVTIVALLLAMSTARANPVAPSAVDYAQAAEALAHSTYEQFVGYAPTQGTLVVTESWGLAEGDPEVWRQLFVTPLDDLDWSIDIRPLTDLLGASLNASPSCDDHGVCVEVGDGYRIRLEMGIERGEVKLFSIDVAHDAALGC